MRKSLAGKICFMMPNVLKRAGYRTGIIGKLHVNPEPREALRLRPALPRGGRQKSQCQVLERTQPGLPLGVGEVRTKTHDYKRHGTITLFAALNYLDGKLIARTEECHTHVEWLRFLKQIDRETRKDLDLHLIVDNYCTHKEENVHKWLQRHPRFHIHFTPTSSSWLNLVERFFRDLSEDVIKDGSFSSVRELIKDIEDYLAQRNLNPKPYKWKAKGEEILRKIQRAKEAVKRQASHES